LKIICLCPIPDEAPVIKAISFMPFHFVIDVQFDNGTKLFRLRVFDLTQMCQK